MRRAEKWTLELWGLEGLKALEVSQSEPEKTPRSAEESASETAEVTLGTTGNLAKPQFPYR